MPPPAITYLGWSGFRIETDAGPLFIDPPVQTKLPAGAQSFVLLSHGHPEHLSGIRAHLRSSSAGARMLALGSPALCDHLQRSYPDNGMTVMAVRPGDAFELAAGLSVQMFEWTHLPLLPGGFAANVRHVRRLASRPALAMKIAWAGLSGPTAGPMLGFRIRVGSWQILAYGEGLHRFCRPEEAGGPPRRTLVLAGVEPGDEAGMPGLLDACGAGRALLFEPHAKWRDAFGMERVDLASLCRRIEGRGIEAEVARPNARLGVGFP